MPVNPRDAEEAAQRDPLERAKRLRAFKAKTADRVWYYVEKTGMWTLIDHLDGTTPLDDPAYSFSRVA